MNQLLILVLVSGMPFVDAQRRFSLELPSGWESGPIANDAARASFRCKRGDSLALAAVQMFDVRARNPAVIARQIAEGIREQPGYQLLEEGSGEIAGLPAARRRYLLAVDADHPEMIKVAEDRVAVHDGRAYVVHVEALRPDFDGFAADFEQIFLSFNLGSTPRSPKKRTELVGKWRRSGGQSLFLQLSEDGTFDLAGTAGRYRVLGNRLLLSVPTGTEEFTWSLDGDDLVLRSQNLDGPVSYQRVSGASSDTLLDGVWKGGGRQLVLGPKQRVEIDGRLGAYRIKGDRIIFRLQGKRHVARFALEGDEIELSGGGFGKRTVLHRQP